MLTYDTKLGSHKITALLGQEALDSHWKGMTGEGHGFISNDIYTLTMAEDTQVTSYKGSQSLNSYFARLIYDFDNRYSLTASIRRDQSSKFDPDVNNGKNQVGYFPAVAISWRVTKEKFLEWIPSNIVSNLRFRAGYGETGNQQIPNNLYSSQLTIYNNPQNLNNPDLKWETMKQTNVGADLTLFRRLNVSFDWYNKKSSDFLFQLPLPGYLTGGDSYYGGISSPYSNIGSMVNKGYDITIGYETRGEGLNWSTNLNISHYKNNLESLINGMDNLTQEVNINGYQPMIATNTLIGQSIGTFWGFQYDGLYRTQADIDNGPTVYDKTPSLGDVKYVDINGDGVINDQDKTIIGNPHPDVTFGFTNTLRYKNFDLSVFIQGSIGNDILNLTKRNGLQNAMMYQNQLEGALDFWTAENPNASLPRLVNSTSHPNNMISSRYVEKGDYIRIQNLTLGYTLSPEFTSQLKVSRLRMYVTAQNLFIVVTILKLVLSTKMYF